jgi:hypothetical protein
MIKPSKGERINSAKKLVTPRNFYVPLRAMDVDATTGEVGVGFSTEQEQQQQTVTKGTRSPHLIISTSVKLLKTQRDIKEISNSLPPETVFKLCCTIGNT